MRVIQVQKRKEINHKDFIRRSALDSDYKELIKENVMIKEGDRPIVVYLTANEMVTGKLVSILKKLDIDRNYRTQGLWSQSKIFGYMPREQIRKDYCSSTAFARESPEDHDFVCKFGNTLSQYYQKYCPEMYARHMALTQEKILPDWQIEGSPFTSGIINKNNPLKYHFDYGNLDKVYSNMVCFRSPDCEGGHLALPEFDVGLEIGNKSLLFFDGQDIMHGVTPFKLKSMEAYRYTIVYYTLKQMWKCETITSEIARIRKRKSDRELVRYKRLTGELKPEDDPFMKDVQKDIELFRSAKPANFKHRGPPTRTTR